VAGRRTAAIAQDTRRPPSPRQNDRLFPNRTGWPLDNWDGFQKRLFNASGTAAWHRHDVCRTCATMLGDRGVAPHVIEIVLGRSVPHTAPAGIYNRSRYAPEHRAALQSLADGVEALRIRAVGVAGGFVPPPRDPQLRVWAQTCS
jgi:hypothetical protein